MNIALLNERTKYTCVKVIYIFPAKKNWTVLPIMESLFQQLQGNAVNQTDLCIGKSDDLMASNVEWMMFTAHCPYTPQQSVKYTEISLPELLPAVSKSPAPISITHGIAVCNILNHKIICYRLSDCKM